MKIYIRAESIEDIIFCLVGQVIMECVFVYLEGGVFVNRNYAVLYNNNWEICHKLIESSEPLHLNL